MSKKISVVNIKANMPNKDDARQELIKQIERKRREGVAVMKIIHGYGSTGVGGTLREELRKSLRRRKSEGSVVKIIHGENWSIFDEESQRLLLDYPELKKDVDLERYNEGITIVELN